MTISIIDDMLDSRDIIERIDELVAEIEAAEANNGDVDGLTTDEIEALRVELAMWREFESAGAEDWEHGAQFIRSPYFKDYAEQLAEECGMIDKKAVWPMNCIDWDEAASQLKQDYSLVSVGGEDWYYR
jgi:hypothetical protein